jgi:Tfp pilus assembly protein PilF
MPANNSSMTTTAGSERTPSLKGPQVADIQVALGRSLERRQENEQAMDAYSQALKQDPNCGDAALRLAILYDRQGRFKESEQFYRRALAAKPGNVEIFCDRGYSLCLQHHWAEAEMNLRQAIALQPNHARAHNNLGLVLAHTNRTEEALAEFRRAGCNEPDAQTNLAFVLTLDERWAEARNHYEYALAQDHLCARAKQGLEELSSLVAKVGRAGSDIRSASFSFVPPPPTGTIHPDAESP